MSRRLSAHVPTPIQGKSPETSFDVRLIETAADDVTVQLIGELDVASAQRVTGVMQSHGCPKVVRLELSELTFADCAGLRVIETIRDRTHAHGGRLVLMHPSAKLHWLLRVTGIAGPSSQCTVICGSEEDADA